MQGQQVDQLCLPFGHVAQVLRYPVATIWAPLITSDNVSLPRKLLAATSLVDVDGQQVEAKPLRCMVVHHIGVQINLIIRELTCQILLGSVELNGSLCRQPQAIWAGKGSVISSEGGAGHPS